MGLPRWVHRVRARLGGYFWLPCPECGRMFGGHECGPILWDDETRTRGKMLCRLHEEQQAKRGE